MAMVIYGSARKEKKGNDSDFGRGKLYIRKRLKKAWERGRLELEGILGVFREKGEGRRRSGLSEEFAPLARNDNMREQSGSSESGDAARGFELLGKRYLKGAEIRERLDKAVMGGNFRDAERLAKALRSIGVGPGSEESFVARMISICKIKRFYSIALAASHESDWDVVSLSAGSLPSRLRAALAAEYVIRCRRGATPYPLFDSDETSPWAFARIPHEAALKGMEVESIRAVIQFFSIVSAESSKGNLNDRGLMCVPIGLSAVIAKVRMEMAREISKAESLPSCRIPDGQPKNKRVMIDALTGFEDTVPLPIPAPYRIRTDNSPKEDTPVVFYKLPLVY